MAYTKNNALKGRRFASLGEHNARRLHREEQVADKRVHGTTLRQVAAVFEEERKALEPLPAWVYKSYQEGQRVRRDSFVEVTKAYYEAPPEPSLTACYTAPRSSPSTVAVTAWRKGQPIRQQKQRSPRRSAGTNGAIRRPPAYDSSGAQRAVMQLHCPIPRPWGQRPNPRSFAHWAKGPSLMPLGAVARKTPHHDTRHGPFNTARRSGCHPAESYPAVGTPYFMTTYPTPTISAAGCTFEKIPTLKKTTTQPISSLPPPLHQKPPSEVVLVEVITGVAF